TPAAIPDVDYFPTNETVTFDDFQMSKDYYMYITARGSLFFNYGADWPDTNGNYILPDVNGRLLLTMSNPALDPQENPAIQPPNLGPVSTAELNILDTLGNNNQLAYGNALLPFQVLFQRQTNGGFFAFNFERSFFRVNKDVGSNVTIWVELSGEEGPSQTPS